MKGGGFKVSKKDQGSTEPYYETTTSNDAVVNELDTIKKTIAKERDVENEYKKRNNIILTSLVKEINNINFKLQNITMIKPKKTRGGKKYRKTRKTRKLK